MALELTCLNISSSLPSIPVNNNLTNIPSHSNYNPNGRAITQLISSSLAGLTFSINHVEAFLKQVTSDNIQTWDVSTIVNIKPVTSTIIYLSIALALFIVLLVTFCIISCTNCCRRKSVKKEKQMKKCKCRGECICFVLILLIVLLVIGQMIYISYQVNRTKIFVDDSIKEMNQDIYPKQISIYLRHLIEQFQQLDQYLTQIDSILIKASKSIFVKPFDPIFREKYFFAEIRQFSIDSSLHINELIQLINQETGLSNETIDLLQIIQEDNNRLFDDLEKPLQELCNYANGTDSDIDTTIIQALNQVHQQLIKLIDTIEKDFLNRMTSLLNIDLEDKIRWYIRLVGIILFVLVIVIGFIPIIFFIFIVLCRLCHCQQNYTSPNYRMSKNGKNASSRRSVSNVKSSSGRSSIVLCCMRIFFIPMIIILIVIVIVSGVLYGVDLVAQGACQTVHYDRSFLVSFLIDELLGTNTSDLIIGGSDVKTTITTIIDDCGNKIHFTEHFLKNHLSHLDNDIDHAINQLNQKIYDKFNTSIKDIDITMDIDNLNQLSNLINSNETKEKIQQIEDDLTKIQRRFENISDSVPTLPTNLVNQTMNDFRNYLNNVIESTMDPCPLPLATIYKTDTLICHDFAASINGLWLSLFVYMFFIIFGLCICGLCLYKRSQPLSSNRSISDIYQYKNNVF